MRFLYVLYVKINQKLGYPYAFAYENTALKDITRVIICSSFRHIYLGLDIKNMKIAPLLSNLRVVE